MVALNGQKSFSAANLVEGSTACPSVLEGGGGGRGREACVSAVMVQTDHLARTMWKIYRIIGFRTILSSHYRTQCCKYQVQYPIF